MPKSTFLHQIGKKSCAMQCNAKRSCQFVNPALISDWLLMEHSKQENCWGEKQGKIVDR